MTRRQLVGLAGAALGSVALTRAVSQLGPFREREAPEATPGEGSRRHFPNVEVRTHENKTVRFYEDLLKGRTVVVNFTHTSCDDGCPPVTRTMKRLQELLGPRLGKDVFIYSITLDPHHDTPEVLASYARNNGARRGWLFLTGEHQAMEDLRKSFGMWEPDPVEDADMTHHVGMIWYGIEPLSRWGACHAYTRPELIARFISWAEPGGERPHVHA